MGETIGLGLDSMLDSEKQLFPLAKTMVFKEVAIKKGRLLQNPVPQVDPKTDTEYYTYRKILGYNKEKGLVQISQEGSVLNPDALNQFGEDILVDALPTSDFGQYYLRSPKWDITTPVKKG